MKRSSYVHQFVRAFPDSMEAGVLYVSVDFGSAAHLCFCGCGQEVYTRLSPRDWSLIFDGETVSIDPSIGNWSFPCQSHYWLRRGKVRWAERWSKEKIDAGRMKDRTIKDAHFGIPGEPAILLPPSPRTFARWASTLNGWLLKRFHWR